MTSAHRYSRIVECNDCVTVYSLWVLRLEPVEQGIFVEGSSGSTVTAVELDIGDGVRVLHHLDEPHLVSSGQAAIRGHPVSEIDSVSFL